MTPATLTALAGPLCAVLVGLLFAALATARLPRQGGEASAEHVDSAACQRT